MYKSTYLNMLFILEMANYVQNGASKVKLGSDAGAWYTECNCTTFVTVSQLLMERGKFFAHLENILTEHLNFLRNYRHLRDEYIAIIVVAICTLGFEYFITMNVEQILLRQRFIRWQHEIDLILLANQDRIVISPVFALLA